MAIYYILFNKRNLLSYSLLILNFNYQSPKKFQLKLWTFLGFSMLRESQRSSSILRYYWWLALVWVVFWVDFCSSLQVRYFFTSTYSLIYLQADFSATELLVKKILLLDHSGPRKHFLKFFFFDWFLIPRLLLNPILTLDCQSQSNPLNRIAIQIERSSNPIQQYHCKKWSDLHIGVSGHT